MFFRILLLFAMPTSAWAYTPHGCGTEWDPEVEKIAENIIGCLRKVELVDEPELCEITFYEEDEDGEEVEEEALANCWTTNRFTESLYKVWWECEATDPYTINNKELRDFRTTFEIIDEIENDLEGIRDDEINTSLGKLDRWDDEYHQYTKKVQIKEEKEKIRIQERIFDEKIAHVHDLRKNTRRSYLNIYANCIREHNWPKAHYERGLLYFKNGEFFNAFQDIGNYIASEDFKNSFFPKYEYETFGKLQNILGQYENAIEALNKALKESPKDKDVLLERASAYFELGKFELALEDYLKIKKGPKQIGARAKSTLEFAAGLITGTSFSAVDCIENFAPSLLCSLQGLANGLWAFALNPEEVSQDMVNCGRNIYEFLHEKGIREALQIAIPEIGNLTKNWEKESEYKKGELIGNILGKYGTDVLLMAGSMKSVKLFMELRAANAALTLDAMKSFDKRKHIQEISQSWKTHVAQEAAKIKKKEALKEIAKKYKNANLNELEIRKILHNMDTKTFRKPIGIPENCKVQIALQNGGMKYISKKNKHISVRVMPGNPNSPNPAQKKPYVVHRTPAGCMDKNGKIVPTKSAEAHIPLEEYDFNKLSKGLLDEW